VDETNEIYPTCYGHSFGNSQEFRSQVGADAQLTTSPQAGVSRSVTLDAMGRVLEKRTTRTGATTSTALEDVVFTYDVLGHKTGMTRYQDPANKAGAVTTNWHYDSLGWMTKLEKTGVAPQTRVFDSWGEVTQTQWCDDLSAVPCAATD